MIEQDMSYTYWQVQRGTCRTVTCRAGSRRHQKNNNSIKHIFLAAENRENDSVMRLMHRTMIVEGRRQGGMLLK